MNEAAKRLIHEKIDETLEEFFEGESHWNRGMGFFWVANHGRKAISKEDWTKMKQLYCEPPSVHSTDEDNVYINDFQTLTFEPISGGQYEIAVRIWSDGEWKGYKMNTDSIEKGIGETSFRGVNTSGH